MSTETAETTAQEATTPARPVLGIGARIRRYLAECKLPVSDHPETITLQQWREAASEAMTTYWRAFDPAGRAVSDSEGECQQCGIEVWNGVNGDARWYVGRDEDDPGELEILCHACEARLEEEHRAAMAALPPEPIPYVDRFADS